MKLKFLFPLLILAPAIAYSQTKHDTLWMAFKPFLGKWAGESDGQPGKGKYERSYEFVLNKRFMEVRNKSVYPPTDKKPSGEVHEDYGFISYDRSRKSFVLRQFHVESFVIQYKIESISPDLKTIVFISEAIENIPAGYRARETYQFTNTNEFTEIFELAEPGKDFTVYSKAVLRRSQ